MKVLHLIIAGLILISACNTKKDKTEQTGTDSLTGTDTTERPLDISNNMSDTTTPVVDDKKPVTDNSTTTNSPISWSKLVSGSQSRIEKNSLLVITNKTKFDELWKIAFANDIAPQKPDVDFTKNSVVALFLGEVTSGGHSIELTSIKTSTAESYLISVLHTKPGRGCMSTTVMEYPYFLAKTNKLASDKADFKMSTKETRCE